jgi:2'-hydroxyisoflavone reductase
MSTRREFLHASAAGMGALSLAASPLAGAPRPAGATPPGAAPARRALSILILGGTGFIGPYEVRYAVARGHRVTVFNRGRRQADLPDAVEHLTGDRVTGDLAALKGRRWDVVIDNPTTLPRWVRDAGEVLRGNTGQYIFISTISVYGSLRTPPDEASPVARWDRADDPLVHRESSRELMQHYGALKARSEQEAEKWFPGKVTVIRPGLIVGPNDPTDRFTYWPVRIDRGGEVLCPGTPDDPAQVIDARDLSEWTIRMAEQGATGIYNATGPRARLSFAEMLYGIRAATSGDNQVRFTWAPADFLAQHGVRPWSDMPVWFPPGSEMGALAETRIDRAVANGLTFRPLAVTARDTIDWFATLPAERRSNLLAGLRPAREAEVLKAWHEQRGR